MTKRDIQWYYGGVVGRNANVIFYIGKRYRLPPREGEISCGGETVNRAKHETVARTFAFNTKQAMDS